MGRAAAVVPHTSVFDPSPISRLTGPLTAAYRASRAHAQFDIPLQAPDEVTGTVLFPSSCDPVGGNPYGEQIFAMRSDGTGIRTGDAGMPYQARCRPRWAHSSC